MLLSDFVRATLLVVMALTDQLWLRLTAAFLVGAVSQFFVPAIQASFPNLIDKTVRIPFARVKASGGRLLAEV
ncbi:MAG: hypothetical protein ACM3TT_02170 [Syntrophothermus sp.]